MMKRKRRRSSRVRRLTVKKKKKKRNVVGDVGCVDSSCFLLNGFATFSILRMTADSLSTDVRERVDAVCALQLLPGF